ncbi:hypothetical protein [Candidatus Poriferisocius sp.]|uniref:hypothetical protein n=1 Tax=Candidatus Poriferisocius sp. TaxID=3101276 RepID=UPI003B5B0D28
MADLTPAYYPVQAWSRFGNQASSAFTWMVCQPVAPSGAGLLIYEVWVAPVPSMARTLTRCSPGEAFQVTIHCRQELTVVSRLNSAPTHTSPSTCTSTRSIARLGAQATPAIAVGPGSIVESRRGSQGGIPEGYSMGCGGSGRV